MAERIASSQDSELLDLLALLGFTVGSAMLTPEQIRNILSKKRDMISRVMSALDELSRTAESKVLTFTFSSDAMVRMEAMQKATGVSGHKETILRALRVFEWYQKQIDTGHDICIVQGNEVVRAVKFEF